MRQKPPQSKSLSAAARGYASLLTDIKQRIRTAQVRTSMVGNASMLLLYWEIGGVLVRRQNAEGWGAAILPRLATDLRNDLPEVKGFSVRNLKLMTQFFREYPDFASIGQPPVAQLAGLPTIDEIGPQPVAQLNSAAAIRTQPVSKLDRRLPLGRNWRAHRLQFQRRGQMSLFSSVLDAARLKLEGMVER